MWDFNDFPKIRNTDVRLSNFPLVIRASLKLTDNHSGWGIELWQTPLKIGRANRFFVRNLGGGHGSTNFIRVQRGVVTTIRTFPICLIMEWQKRIYQAASAQQIQAIRLYLLVSKLVNGQSRFGAEDPHWDHQGLGALPGVGLMPMFFFRSRKFGKAAANKLFDSMFC